MEFDSLKVEEAVENRENRVIHRTSSEDTIVMNDEDYEEEFEEDSPFSIFRESREMCLKDIYSDFSDSEAEDGEETLLGETIEEEEITLELPHDVDLGELRGDHLSSTGKRRMSSDGVDQLSVILEEVPAKIMKLEN